MTTPITWTETVTPEPVRRVYVLRVYNEATKESIRSAEPADLERCGYVPRSRLEEVERERDEAHAKIATLTADMERSNALLGEAGEAVRRYGAVVEAAQRHMKIQRDPARTTGMCLKGLDDLGAAVDAYAAPAAPPEAKAEQGRVNDAAFRDIQWTPGVGFAAGDPASPPEMRPICRGCGKPLLPENLWMADGCPCNSRRGINHGLVAKNICTCIECDPEQTGATRHPYRKEPAPQPWPSSILAARELLAAEAALGRPLASGETLADAVGKLVAKVAAVETDRRELAELRRVFKEAQEIARLKYEVTHKGSGPPSDYDPDIYQLEKVTATGWWRFVHTVNDVAKALKDGAK